MELLEISKSPSSLSAGQVEEVLPVARQVGQRISMILKGGPNPSSEFTKNTLALVRIKKEAES